MNGTGRVAAIYDVHGNLPALEAVLADIDRVAPDLVVVGGDVVPGPMPSASLDLLAALDRPVRFLRGNGDREVLGCMRGEEPGVPEAVRAVIRWNAAQLGPVHEALIAGWPATVRVRARGIGEVLFCHATPDSDTRIVTRLTGDEGMRGLFAGVAADVVVCGHTHMPFDRTVGALRIVNAGSVGMPFGEPGAHWLLLGPGVEPRHTSYDLAAAADRIRATDYPRAADFADRHVLSTPSEDEMLAAFAAADGRRDE